MGEFRNLRSLDALGIIHLGYDPDKVDFVPGETPHEFVPRNIFNKPGDFALVHSYGSWVYIEERNENELMNLTQLVLPNTTIVRSYEQTVNVFTIETLNDSEGRPGYSFRSGNIEMTGQDIPGITGYALNVGNKIIKVLFNVDISSPFNGVHHTLIVPMLPFKQRDLKFWQKLSETYGLELSEGTKGKNGMVTYHASREGLLEIELSSIPVYSDHQGGLNIFLRLTRPVDGKVLIGLNPLSSFGSVHLEGQLPKKGLIGSNISIDAPRRESFIIPRVLERILHEEEPNS
ncbi:hypothetical protein HYT57_03520 [Candidatus Woesearchaeota archaeon]|nr:hypothetical protein [Candidatus Woesearchaeota archaeon]